jgi:hypothetical protein
MANQRFFKIVCFRFPTNVPQKIENIRFEKKFVIEPKRSLSDLKTFSPKAIVLKNSGTQQHVLVLFQSFWSK